METKQHTGRVWTRGSVDRDPRGSHLHLRSRVNGASRITEPTLCSGRCSEAVGIRPVESTSRPRSTLFPGKIRFDLRYLGKPAPVPPSALTPPSTRAVLPGGRSTTHRPETYLCSPPASMREPFWGGSPAAWGRRARAGLSVPWFSRLCTGRLQVIGDNDLQPAVCRPRGGARGEDKGWHSWRSAPRCLHTCSQPPTPTPGAVPAPLHPQEN